MPLRSPNTPVPSSTLLAAMRAVIPPDTRLPSVTTSDPTGLSQVYVRDLYRLSRGAFPAVNLTTGPQTFTLATYRGYEGLISVQVAYYDRWNESPQTIDAIRRALDDDLERIRANLESAQTLVANGQALTVAMPHLTIGPDKAELDQTFPGITMVYRTLTASYVVLPYDA